MFHRDNSRELALIERLSYQLIQTNNSLHALIGDMSEKLMAFTEEGRSYQRMNAEIAVLKNELAAIRDRPTAPPEPAPQEPVQRWADDKPGGM